MYAKIALLTAVLATTSLAHAGETVSALALETGLSERSIRMLVGARTPYAEYRSSYARVDRRFKEAVGEVRYQLLTGREAGRASGDRNADTRVTQRKQAERKQADLDTDRITGL